MFRSNVPPPSSWSKNKPNKKPGKQNWSELDAGFLLHLFFDPEDEDDMFHRSVYLPLNYTAPQSSRPFNLIKDV
jgi:hypothetical protein